jgi:hypothetical protein
MSLRERTRAGLGIIEPRLPSPAKVPPSGAGWIHEIKHDGFRILARRGPGGLRKTYILFGVLCLAEAGCAALPQTFTRIDGRELDRKQLLTDQAMCRGEIKGNLSTGNQTTALGPTEDAIAVYTGCMAQHGYKVAK